MNKWRHSETVLEYAGYAIFQHGFQTLLSVMTNTSASFVIM